VTIDVRLPFSLKEFHQRGWDKQMLGGGAAVELMDYLNNRSNCEKCSAKMMGFLLTSLGGALAATAIYLVASLFLV